MSGAKGRDKRPAFDKLCKDAAARRFDLVAAWSVHRLGRSLQDLVAFLGELRALGIDLFLKQQGLDTTTASGRAMFGMLGVFAEFERAMIQERVKPGLERARVADKRLGRPSVVTEKDRRQIAAVRAEGASVRAIARAVGLPLARRTDEGAALDILAVARLLAHQHDGGLGRPFAEHRLRRPLVEIAGGAACRQAAQFLQRLPVADVAGGAVLLLCRRCRGRGRC